MKMMKTTTHPIQAVDQGGNGILVFALYNNKIYEDDEDYYSYPIQAVDQGGNGILVFALYNN